MDHYGMVIYYNQKLKYKIVQLSNVFKLFTSKKLVKKRKANYYLCVANVYPSKGINKLNSLFFFFEKTSFKIEGSGSRKMYYKYFIFKHAWKLHQKGDKIR